MSALNPLKTALGLTEDAKLSDLRAAINEVLLAEMTPEEKSEMEKDDEALTPEEKAKLAARLQQMEATEKAIRTALNLDDKADIVASLKGGGTDVALSENARLAMTVKELSERVSVLEPKAAIAEALEKQAKDTARDLFFSEQIRAGKLTPADKPFYTSMWGKDETEVRKFFDGRKASSVVKLHEVGTGLHGPAPVEDQDPREALRELAEKRSVEKDLAFVEALNQVKHEHPELTEAVAAMYGPSGLRR